MLSKEESESQMYKEVLRKVIRSQILHMVDELAETGEESFVISACGEDEEPHILGSKQGLAYMQGFRGVQDGFPSFIQKNLISPKRTNNIGSFQMKRSRSTANPLEDPFRSPFRSGSDLIGATQTKLFASKLQFQDDWKIKEVSNDTVANVTNFDNQLPTTSSELETEAAEANQEFVQERNGHSFTNEIPMETSDVSSQIDNLESNCKISNAKQMPDLERFDSEESDAEKLAEENVMPDETTNILETVNEASRNSTDKVDETVDDSGVDILVDLQTEAENSDEDDDSDDCYESDYDEMKEDEIFSKFINGFRNTKKDLSADDTKTDDHSKENIQEHDGQSSTEAEKKDMAEENSSEKDKVEENLSEMDENNKSSMDNGDEVSAVVSTNARAIIGYRYRNNVYHLKDILSPENLVCKYCQKESRTIKDLKEHEGIHSRLYRCYKCERNFISIQKLRCHHSRCFNVPKIVKDFFQQNPNFKPKPRSNKHKLQENSSEPDLKKSFKCDACSRKFQYSFGLKKHVCKPVLKDRTQSEQSNRSPTPVKETANSGLSFKAHMSSLAETSRILGDANNTTVLNYDQNIKKKHIKQDDRIRKHKCTYCNKRYLTSSHLKEHIQIHTGEKNLKCSVCLKKFMRRSQFTKHKPKCDAENPGEYCGVIRLNGQKRKMTSHDEENLDKNKEKKADKSAAVDREKVHGIGDTVSIVKDNCVVNTKGKENLNIGCLRDDRISDCQ